MKTIEKQTNGSQLARHNRLIIKGFKTSDAMYKFLCKSGNGCYWKESTRGLKPGTYAYAGGQWHNVKNLDSSVLAHI